MTPFQALLLGIVQGATEFLPISSSGHLVLVPWLLNWDLDPSSAFIFDVLVQWGTILAVILYFRRDLLNMIAAVLRGISRRRPFEETEARLAWLILLASVPAAVLGLLLKPVVEQAFDSPLAVSFFLLATAGILFLSERLHQADKPLKALNWADSLWIGLAQALALFPGISRSGSTIAGGLIRSLGREDAARFSFLLAIPTMLGAGTIALVDLSSIPDPGSQLLSLVIGFASAAIVGMAALHWLLSYLRNHSLDVFAIYCTVVGLGGLILYAIKG
jgi:undecaprenyl-diphosphatase